MSKPIFYKDQKVGCLLYGEGVVRCIREIPTAFVFPLEVLFEDGIGCRNYTINGSYFTDSSPTLYPIEQYREIIANLPAPQPEAWKPKPGEWCWFWDQCNENESAVLRKFKHSTNYVYTDEKGVNWQNCAPFTGELPPHLKEVQP